MPQKDVQDMIDLHSGKDEVEITEELITKLIEEKKWKDENSLRHFAKMGAKWNLKRNSVIINQ
jgi:hypothetical protein